jgi:hypothetical protein
MWLFTPEGFYSAVLSDTDNDKLKVRARDRSHLEALVQHLPEGDRPEILSIPNRDYAYRVIIPKATWAYLVCKFAANIDYSNFKDECKKQGQPKTWLSALADVWRAGWLHQNRRQRP